MFGLLKLKDYIYIGALVIIASAAFYKLQTWHYAPLREKDAKIEQLETTLKQTGDKLNECLSAKPKESVEAFIEGVESNENNISVDLGNLHT